VAGNITQLHFICLKEKFPAVQCVSRNCSGYSLVVQDWSFMVRGSDFDGHAILVSRCSLGNLPLAGVYSAKDSPHY